MRAEKLSGNTSVLKDRAGQTEGNASRAALDGGQRRCMEAMRRADVVEPAQLQFGKDEVGAGGHLKAGHQLAAKHFQLALVQGVVRIKEGDHEMCWLKPCERTPTLAHYRAAKGGGVHPIAFGKSDRTIFAGGHRQSRVSPCFSAERN